MNTRRRSRPGIGPRTRLIPLAAEQEKALAKHAGIATKEEEEPARHSPRPRRRCAGRRDAARALAEAAAKAQEVVKRLPKEKELADAARVFAKRSGGGGGRGGGAREGERREGRRMPRSSPNERAALAGRSRRLGPRPSRSASRCEREESKALEARRKMAERRVALEDHQRRVAALEAYARWQGIRERVAANRGEVAGRRAAVDRRRGSEPASTRTSSGNATGCVASGRAEASRRRQAAGRGRGGDGASSEGVRPGARRDRRHAVGPGAPAGGRRPGRGRAEAQGQGRRAASAGEPRLKSRGDAAGQGATARRPRRRPRRTRPSRRRSPSRSAARTPRVRPGRTLAAAEQSRPRPLRTELAGAADELASQMGDRFAMAQLKPLTPEQMCWSILKVTGVYDRYAKLEEAGAGQGRSRSPVRPPRTRRSCAPGRSRSSKAHVRQAQGEPARVHQDLRRRRRASRRTTSSRPPTRPCSRPMAGRSTAGSRRRAGTSPSG